MATSKPRITITLTHHQHEVLKAISETSGQPMSVFVTELLEVSMPTIERMAVTFQKLKQAQIVEREKFLQSMDETQTIMEGLAQQVTGQFDLFLSSVEQNAGVGGVTPGGAGGYDAHTRVLEAPPTNRGATTPPGIGNKPKRGKASGAVSGLSVLKKKSVSRSDNKG